MSFWQRGGDQFSYIPALNDSPAHIAFLSALLRDNIGDWLSHLQIQNTDAARKTRLQNAETARKTA